MRNMRNKLCIGGNPLDLVGGLSVGGTVWKGTDGAVMSYRCCKSIFGQTMLSFNLNVSIDAQVEAPGHGKWWLNRKTGSDKRYCQQCMCLGGPAQVFPPKRFFLGGRPLFPKRKKHPKNRQTPNKESPFFDQDENRPPHRRDFTIDLQRRWSINHNIGDRQFTYYLIVRALTITVLLFFL